MPDEPAIHLLDVGSSAYGDATLVRTAGRSILIDGAHPGDEGSGPGRADLAGQLGQIFGHSGPYDIDLLVVSHGHLDHIGALPAMVNSGLVRFEWALVADPDLAWGRGGDSDAAVRSNSAVLAALREEPLPLEASDAAISGWIADAVTLEDRYRSMLARLAADGTKVVRHVRDDHTELVRSFRSQGLRILGPSEAQALLCADAIARSTNGLDARLARVLDADSNIRQVDLYRAAFGAGADAATAADASRLGEAVNLQSLVLALTLAGRRALLGGDMPFGDPGLGDPGLRDEMTALAARVARRAPYGFAKATHHGSANGIDGALLDELGLPIMIGITTGTASRQHPSRELLELLKQRPGVHWVRTDRNGRSTLIFDEDAGVTAQLSRGALDDSSPPGPQTPDVVAPTAARPAAAISPPGLAVTRQPTTDGSIEISLRLPTGQPQRITIEVDAAPAGPPPSDQPRPEGGRLSGIVAITSREALASNLGRAEADWTLTELEALGCRIVDLPANAPIADAAEQTRRAAAGGQARGVLIVGGFDVVPSQAVDALPPEIRQRTTEGLDMDDFIVWSDDTYADLDGDGLAELPHSRIPDARSAPLVRAALGAPAVTLTNATAVRNYHRPFADRVYATIQRGVPMLVSEPTRPGPPAHPMVGALVYLMLHGDYSRAHLFEGERADRSYLEAIDVSDIGPAVGAVVFAGCCWGALSVDTTAVEALAGRRPAPWPPERSMALTYLQQGARAFVGCTGVHYSPVNQPFYHYGEPMHHFFFEELQAGKAPAVALHDAKQRYVVGIPYGPRDLRSQAIEYKIWRQFTCLGIGW